jgi:FlaA1/EpsC-like NDP-sugar epimerase
MTIPEACQLIMQAAVIGQGGETFVLDMGEPVKIRYLAEQMIRLAGREPGRDIRIQYTGLRPGEKLYEELFYESEAYAPTPHPKIRVARPVVDTKGDATMESDAASATLPATLAALPEALARGDEAELAALLAKVVKDWQPSAPCRDHRQDRSSVPLQ